MSGVDDVDAFRHGTGIDSDILYLSLCQDNMSRAVEDVAWVSTCIGCGLV